MLLSIINILSYEKDSSSNWAAMFSMILFFHLTEDVWVLDIEGQRVDEGVVGGHLIVEFVVF